MSDIRPGDWADRYAPPRLRPYIRLARLDRPIGTWLLLFPGWWGIALAARRWPDWRLIALFAIGAVAMRGAGCTFNDIADREFDAKVARTRTRPIPSGAVSVRQAVLFMAFELGVGAAVLASLKPRGDRARRARPGADRDLSLHEAHHLLAAILPRPQLQLGRAHGLGRGAATGSVLPALLALSRRHRLDARLRHHLRPSGQGGRRADRRQIGGARAWARGRGRFFSCSMPRRWRCGRRRARPTGSAPRSGRRSRSSRVQLGWQAARVDIDDPADCLAKFKSNRLTGWLLFVRHHRRACRLIPAAFIRANTVLAAPRSCRRSGFISRARSRRCGRRPRRCSRADRAAAALLGLRLGRRAGAGAPRARPSARWCAG